MLGKAIRYALERQKQVMLFVDNGAIPIDNNGAEYAIRPFVIGRKNRLFCDTVAGAEATAVLYSLIESAKMNGWGPFRYLKTLFEKLPDVNSKEDFKNLLPQYLPRDEEASTPEIDSNTPF